MRASFRGFFVFSSCEGHVPVEDEEAEKGDDEGEALLRSSSVSSTSFSTRASSSLKIGKSPPDPFFLFFPVFCDGFLVMEFPFKSSIPGALLFVDRVSDAIAHCPSLLFLVNGLSLSPCLAFVGGWGTRRGSVRFRGDVVLLSLAMVVVMIYILIDESCCLLSGRVRILIRRGV